MASNREERQQMRLRGAATRKAKEVDFGFSFGLAPGPGSEASSQPVGLGIIPAEPAAPPKTTSSASEKNQSLLLSPDAKEVASSPSSSQDKVQSQRTPGSARNNRPARPSTFDIPGDDGPAEIVRSNKRRRIESPSAFPPSKVAGPITAPNRTRQEINNPPILQNGTTDADVQSGTPGPATTANVPREPVPSPVPAVEIPVAIPQKEQEQHLSTGVPESTAPPESEPPTQEQTKPARKQPMTNGKKEESSRRKGTSSPTGEKAKSKRKRRGSSTEKRSSVEGAAAAAAGPQTEAPVHVSERSAEKPTEPPEGSPAAVEAEQDPKLQREKRRRGRPSTSAQTSPDTNKEAKQGANVSKESTSVPEHGARKTRGRKAKNLENPTDNAATSETTKRKPDVEMDDAPDDADHQPPQQQPEAMKEKSKRGRPSRQSRQSLQKAPEPEPEPEPEVEVEAEPEPTPPQPARKRGRRRKSSPNRDGDTSIDRSTPQQGAEEQDNRPTRKTRSRGETVPVTVHRLANVASLGSIPGDADSSAEDEDSADEISTRQKTKLPSRGGVNPADVLSQICRETLEKTLTTLKNGIANESNQARRAEWTRKKKAVEAFGTELEGRLLELSEMLDSNFVLGVQLKKTKREMMDMRTRLYHVRRERESVALQMDAVRKRHAEEESAFHARSNINNSLHSLELALDRSQNRSTDESNAEKQVGSATTAGLEFMLRRVGEDVSSSAPGGQGGLLRQIKAFNAQLEATARKLEG